MPGPVAINGRGIQCPKCEGWATHYEIEDRGKITGELIACADCQYTKHIPKKKA